MIIITRVRGFVRWYDAAPWLHHGQFMVVISGLIISPQRLFWYFCLYIYTQSTLLRMTVAGKGDDEKGGYRETGREYELGGL